MRNNRGIVTTLDAAGRQLSILWCQNLAALQSKLRRSIITCTDHIQVFVPAVKTNGLGAKGKRSAAIHSHTTSIASLFIVRGYTIAH